MMLKALMFGDDLGGERILNNDMLTKLWNDEVMWIRGTLILMPLIDRK